LLMVTGSLASKLERLPQHEKPFSTQSYD
jgi:hypothetical protein